MQHRMQLFTGTALWTRGCARQACRYTEISYRARLCFFSEWKVDREIGKTLVSQQVNINRHEGASRGRREAGKKFPIVFQMRGHRIIPDNTYIIFLIQNPEKLVLSLEKE